jgi:hypothetical protein
VLVGDLAVAHGDHGQLRDLDPAAGRADPGEEPGHLAVVREREDDLFGDLIVADGERHRRDGGVGGHRAHEVVAVVAAHAVLAAPAAHGGDVPEVRVVDHRAQRAFDVTELELVLAMRGPERLHVLRCHRTSS